MKWFIKNKRKICYHFLFWTVVWLFYVFFFSYNSGNTRLILTFSTILIPIAIITTYVMVYVLIPNYLSTKKYFWFGIYTFITLLFTTFCTILLLILSVAYINEVQFGDLPPLGKNYVYLSILNYLIVALIGFVNLWRKNAQTAIKNSDLQKQLLTIKFKAKEQELVYLKSQIHPHFLFNTLNTIYGLALKKSKDTPDVILKLSSLLDYILYQSIKPKVSLIDEINHIEQYIALEKIRFDDTLKINITSELTNKNILIAPMLLLPFVENAFKHGSIIDGILNIRISIYTTDSALDFHIKNTYKQSNSEGGIGLKNIMERLQILFPENYDLQITSGSEWFQVNLKINL